MGWGFGNRGSALAAPAAPMAPSWRWVALAMLAAVFLELSGASLYLRPAMAWFVGVHELCHALACWLTGGSVESIQADSLHGVTYTRGGVYPIVSCAGYLGCGAIGGLCLRYCSRPAMRRALQGLCAVLAAALLVKGKYFGGGYGIGLAEALLVDAAILWALAKPRRAPFALAFVGCMFLSMGFDDLRTIMFYATDPSSTDAGLLASYLGLPILALPIALAYCGAMSALWLWALWGLAREAWGGSKPARP